MPSQRLLGLLPDLLSDPQEVRNVEYKGPLSWPDAKHKIARAALGLSNTRDGGFVVVGVSQDDSRALHPDGITEDQRRSYNQDDVAEFISSFASDRIETQLSHVEDAGKHFVVVEVSQFRSKPIVSIRGSPDRENQGVKKDTIYVRPYGGKAETRPARAEDIEEVLEVAIELGLRSYVETTASLLSH